MVACEVAGMQFIATRAGKSSERLTGVTHVYHPATVPARVAERYGIATGGRFGGAAAHALADLFLRRVARSLGMSAGQYLGWLDQSGEAARRRFAALREKGGKR